jgi:hypothetical protein
VRSLEEDDSNISKMFGSCFFVGVVDGIVFVHDREYIEYSEGAHRDGAGGWRYMMYLESDQN